MRVTMGMITRQYSKNLNNSLSDLNDTYNRAIDNRAYNKASDDPFAASRGYALRKELAQNNTFQSISDDCADLFTTADSALRSINSNIVQDAGSESGLQAVNGSMNKSNRQIIANKLRKLQDELVSPCNTKFGDKYIFGGSDMTSPPFTVKLSSDGKTKELYYRGVNVDNGKMLNGETTSINGALIQFGTDASGNINSSLNGKQIEIHNQSGASFAIDDSGASKVVITVDLSATSGTNQDLLDTLKANTGTAGTSGTVYDLSSVTMSGDMNRPVSDDAGGVTSDYRVTSQLTDSQLSDLANEQTFVDLGMGISFTGIKANPQSVFDTSIPGLSFLGQGYDKDGDPQNLYSLLGKIADKLDASTDAGHTETLSPDEVTEIGKLRDKLVAQGDILMQKDADVGLKISYLQNTKTNLVSMGDAITAKDDKVEFVEPYDAIMDYYMQQYAYNAALGMGTKIMSKTLLDYMA